MFKVFAVQLNGLHFLNIPATFDRSANITLGVLLLVFDFHLGEGDAAGFGWCVIATRRTGPLNAVDHDARKGVDQEGLLLAAGFSHGDRGVINVRARGTTLEQNR